MKIKWLTPQTKIGVAMKTLEHKQQDRDIEEDKHRQKGHEKVKH